MGKEDKYEMYSVDGKFILTDKIVSNNTAVDMSGFSNGIYIIKTYINNKFSINKIVKNN